MIEDAIETAERSESKAEERHELGKKAGTGVIKCREVTSRALKARKVTRPTPRKENVPESNKAEWSTQHDSAPKLVIAFTEEKDNICSEDESKISISLEEKAKPSRFPSVFSRVSRTMSKHSEFSFRPSILECLPFNATCMLCCTTFNNAFELQAHLALQIHSPREELLYNKNFQYPLFDCVRCNGQRINKDHHCIQSLTENLKVFVDINVREGSPLTCILCEGRRLQSIHHLIIHIVTYHGFRNRPQKDKYLTCPFCHALFKTRNSFTIEAHALEVHLPELVIKKQKLMHPDGQPSNYTMRHFSCHFENTKYSPITEEKCLKDCSSSFPDLCSLIGHLCYAHYPAPKDFLPNVTHPIACKACLFRFKNRTNLRDHVLTFHSHFMRYRATTLAYEVCFTDHCDPAIVCNLCWTVHSSISCLQTHILVYHMDSWRQCGFCKREFCKANETIGPTILYLTMERHVEHHVKQLRDHFEELMAICENRKPPHQEIIPPRQDENYFRQVKIQTHRLTEDDKTDLIMAQFRKLARSESFDLDGIW